MPTIIKHTCSGKEEQCVSCTHCKTTHIVRHGTDHRAHRHEQELSSVRRYRCKLLSSILENLLLNASQAEATTVQLQARPENNRQLVLEIIDNGQGIHEKLLPDLLFAPFKTTSDSGCGRSFRSGILTGTTFKR